MPLYEYVCQSCGRVFEKLVSLAEQAAPACPTCRSTRTQKKVSGFATRSAGATEGGEAAPARKRFT